MSDDAGAAAASLLGSVQAAPPGLKGFDVDTPLSASAAAAFRAKGYRLCVRYVGRTQMAAGRDLTTQEAKDILGAGLALMVVQHVLNPGWSPTADLGAQYGSNAAKFTKQLGFPPGINVWCDLECVNSNAQSADVIAYCNEWYDAVASSGYVPGLYVGDTPGLTAAQTYLKLKFSHYWGAYNVNSDQEPLPRGWQLKQHIGTGGTIAGISTETYDDDTTKTDGRGGTCLWLVADGV
jgi:hypothetical protein